MPKQGKGTARNRPLYADFGSFMEQRWKDAANIPDVPKRQPGTHPVKYQQMMAEVFKGKTGEKFRNIYRSDPFAAARAFNLMNRMILLPSQVVEGSIVVSV